jgi:hypothetical protein
MVVNLSNMVVAYALGGGGPVIFGAVVFLIATPLILWHLTAIRRGPYYITFTPKKRW